MSEAKRMARVGAVVTAPPLAEGVVSEERSLGYVPPKSKGAIQADIHRLRRDLNATVDELSTRVTPQYQLDNLKCLARHTVADAAATFAGAGLPSDPQRARNAKVLLGAAGGLLGLIVLTIGKTIAGHHHRAKENKSLRQLAREVAKVEEMERVGLLEGAAALTEGAIALQESDK